MPLHPRRDAEEVARLIDAARPPLHRTLLMALYATGLRRAELTRLKVNDVDSKRMVIHVQGGKGRRDRDVLLSPKLLEAQRELMPHADIRTTMNVYGKAMDESKRAAHGKVVRLVLPSKVA